MEKCDTVCTPMATTKLDADLQDTQVDQIKYRSMIWGLMYLTASRPDIAFTTFDSGFELIAYSDADLAGCNDDCKSASGGIQFLRDKLVSWSSKKQYCTAMLTAKAEYVSLSACCAQVIWMRIQLLDYGFWYNKIPIYCDSQSAIAISCNPIQHSRTKYINIRYYFIKEHVKKGTFELYFVGMEYQLADLFTKALPKEMFEYLVHRIVFQMAQQLIPTAQLVPKFHTIRRCNNYTVLQSIPCSLECKIGGEILLDHPLSYALTTTIDVPVKFPKIPKRIEEDYHSIKDDILLVSVYTTGDVHVRGMLILNAFLTEEIHATDDFKEYETVFMKFRVLILCGSFVSGMDQRKAPTEGVELLRNVASTMNRLTGTRDLGVSYSRMTSRVSQNPNSGSIRSKVYEELPNPNERTDTRVSENPNSGNLNSSEAGLNQEGIKGSKPISTMPHASTVRREDGDQCEVSNLAGTSTVKVSNYPTVFNNLNVQTCNIRDKDASNVHNIDDVTKRFGVPLNTLKDIDDFVQDLQFILKDAPIVDDYISTKASHNVDDNLSSKDSPSDPIVQSVDTNAKCTSYAGAAGASTMAQPQVNSNFRPLVADPIFNGVNISIPRKVVKKGRSSFARLLIKVNSEADLVDSVTIDAETSPKQDNFTMSNSFSTLNDDEEDEEEVENVYDESANLIKTYGSSSFTAAAVEGNKDDDDSDNKLELGSHKDKPKYVNDDDKGAKKVDKEEGGEMGSLETRIEEKQTTIPTPPRSPRTILSLDKNVTQELTETVHFARCVVVKEVPDLVSQEFNAQALKIIEYLFKNYVQSNVIQVHPTTTTSAKTTSSADLQQQLYFKMKTRMMIFTHIMMTIKTMTPHEGEKRVKRHKASKSLKSAKGSSSKHSTKDSTTYVSKQKQQQEWDEWVEETVIDEDEVIPKDETPELITELQDVDKLVPTIFDYERMRATLNDALSNQLKNAEEYAYHLEQTKNFIENQIVWESRQDDIRRLVPKPLVFLGPQRNPNKPPMYLYNKYLFYLKHGNTKEKKYILSLHKIHAKQFQKLIWKKR
nr:retrovirus-related Pol polyprotein from transposon TNT 1-94 [Tanacetum cinerariifolium]